MYSILYQIIKDTYEKDSLFQHFNPHHVRLHSITEMIKGSFDTGSWIKIAGTLSTESAR